ncbi:uncharacterized protein H6S33_005813 [Morchella sextelata]|uniref:uncharacterized protein n=1 Tax=Morchella sextelata TaxID=1174677 RepID=UPI001D051902|nr:uncharacterized protein H6S33_005813 [Morchella sextelata]KAH0613927.1 hypothetical protein H6S33_005813 [Morchella sextelata]
MDPTSGLKGWICNCSVYHDCPPYGFKATNDQLISTKQSKKCIAVHRNNCLCKFNRRRGRPYSATQPQWLHAQKPRDTKPSILRGYNHSQKGTRKMEVQWSAIVIHSALERGQKSLQVGLLKLSYLCSEEKNGRAMSAIDYSERELVCFLLRVLVIIWLRMFVLGVPTRSDEALVIILVLRRPFDHSGYHAIVRGERGGLIRNHTHSSRYIYIHVPQLGVQYMKGGGTMCMYPHYYMRPISTALATVINITGVVLAIYGIPLALSVNDNYRREGVHDV